MVVGDHGLLVQLHALRGEGKEVLDGDAIVRSGDALVQEGRLARLGSEERREQTVGHADEVHVFEHTAVDVVQDRVDALILQRTHEENVAHILG